jgi:hypothetical protein
VYREMSEGYMKQNRRNVNREMRQETEQEDCEQRDEIGNRTGGLRTER